VLLGKSNGTFATPVSFSVGNSPNFVGLADFNGDGKLDIVTANSGSNNVSVLPGKGNGAFNSKTDFAVGNLPTSLAIADFNGDGKIDLAVTNFNDNTVSLLFGQGNGTFKNQQVMGAGFGPRSIVAGDFNGDGHPDLAEADLNGGTITEFLNNGKGLFTAQTLFPPISQPEAIGVADLNGDGKTDLVVAGYGSNAVAVLLSNGDGTFQNGLTFATSQGPDALAISDLNHDKAPDLVVANYQSANVSVLLNDDSVATHFAVTGPSQVTAGQKATLTITALNQFNTVTTAYAGTVHFSSTDAQAGLPGDTTFLPANLGVIHVTVTLGTAGLQTIRINDTAQSTLTGQIHIKVVPGATTHFGIAGYNFFQTQGVPFSFVVTALDAFGNVTPFTDTVLFTSSDSQARLPQPYQFTTNDNGSHTFTANLLTQGSQTITIVDKKNPLIQGIVTVFVDPPPPPA
jgi:hypothetical protein